MSVHTARLAPGDRGLLLTVLDPEGAPLAQRTVENGVYLGEVERELFDHGWVTTGAWRITAPGYDLTLTIDVHPVGGGAARST